MYVSAIESNVLYILPLYVENAEFFGFGGSFGVVSPNDKLGDVFALNTKKHISLIN